MTFLMALLVLQIYLTEIATVKFRGSIGAIVNLGVCTGLFFIYLLGAFCHWRTAAFVCSALGFVTCAMLYFIPESPSWLYSRGNVKGTFTLE